MTVGTDHEALTDLFVELTAATLAIGCSYIEVLFLVVMMELKTLMALFSATPAPPTLESRNHLRPHEIASYLSWVEPATHWARNLRTGSVFLRIFVLALHGLSAYCERVWQTQGFQFLGKVAFHQ